MLRLLRELDRLDAGHRGGRPGANAARRTLAVGAAWSRPVTYDPCRRLQLEVTAIRGERCLLARGRGPDRGGGPRLLALRREPVIIAWTNPEAVPGLSGDVAGLGGSAAREDSYTGDLEDLEYVTGMVALDSAQLQELLTRPQGHAVARAIVMHELGHVVGLGHVKDPNELMSAENVERVDPGPGDREGLAALGTGRCS